MTTNAAAPGPEPRTAHILARVIGLLRPYPARTATALGLGIPIVGCTVASPLLLRYVIDSGLTAKSPRALMIGAAAMAVVALVAFGAATARRRVGGRLAVDAQRDLRMRTAQQLAALDATWFARARTGTILTSVSSDIDAIRSFLGFGFAFIVIDGLTVCVVLTQMVLLDLRLTLLTVALTVPTLLLGLRYNTELKRSFHRLQARRTEVTSTVHETSAGIAVVKTSGLIGLRNAEFAFRARALREEGLRSIGLRAKYGPLMAAIPQATAALTLLAGGLAVMHGSLTLGTLVAFNAYVATVAALTAGASQLVSSAQRAAVGGARVFEILDASPLVVDRADAIDLPPGLGAEIRMRGVAFRGLHDLEWTVPAGQHVVLIGGAASGKTSIAELLVRDHDPDRGAVTIDGVDVRDLTIASLRTRVIRTEQDPLILSGTLRDNLLIEPELEVDDEQIHRVLHAVDLLDWVRGLPDQLDHRVGERGLTLSGGQRQRIALARAVLRSPRILILDGVLSEVDAHTEAVILQRIPPVLNSTTVVYLGTESTHLRVDEIYELRKGQIRRMDSETPRRAMGRVFGHDEPAAR
jgi:ATP-binding cassette subfamily B protein